MKYIRNFRDLGGIPVENGRAVKAGCFYRCATLQEASKEDIEEIQALGIRTAFDFRDPVEEFPNEKEVYAAANLKRFNYPMALNNEKLFKLQQNRGIRALFARITLDDVKDTYRSLPFDNEGYRAVFKAMQEGNVPFLFHCSAGKDRTGVCGALILTLLGASEKDVLEDYMISLKIRDYVAQQAGREIPKLVRSYMLKRLEALLIVDPELLAAAKEEILKRYGNAVAPFWDWFAAKFGKIRAYVLGALITTFVLAFCGILPTYTESHVGAYVGLILVSAFAGVGISAVQIMPWASLPDVIEVDEYENHVRREGAYYGLMSFLYKFASGSAVFVVGLFLGIFGYSETAEAGTQPESARLAIRIVLSALPGVIFLVSLWFARHTGIDKERFDMIQSELKRRKEGQNEKE